MLAILNHSFVAFVASAASVRTLTKKEQPFKLLL